MFCKNCGKEVTEDATFCPNCGTALDKEVPNAPIYDAPVNNYAPQPAPKKDTSNNIAVLGFVLSFFVALAGLICSIMGYNKAKNEGLDNKGLALAGIIISIVNMVAGSLLYGLVVLPILNFL